MIKFPICPVIYSNLQLIYCLVTPSSLRGCGESYLVPGLGVSHAEAVTRVASLDNATLLFAQVHDGQVLVKDIDKRALM